MYKTNNILRFDYLFCSFLAHKHHGTYKPQYHYHAYENNK